MLLAEVQSNQFIKFTPNTFSRNSEIWQIYILRTEVMNVVPDSSQSSSTLTHSLTRSVYSKQSIKLNIFFSETLKFIDNSAIRDWHPWKETDETNRHEVVNKADVY